MAQPNPSYLQFESGAASVPTLVPSPNYLQFESEGDVFPLLIPSPNYLAWEAEGSVVVSIIPLSPQFLEFEYLGSAPVGATMPKPVLLSLEFSSTYLAADTRPQPTSLMFEALGSVLNFDVPPQPLSFQFEFSKPVVPYQISVLIKTDGDWLSSVSRTTYNGIAITSEILLPKLMNLPQVKYHPYFGDRANWAAVFTVYFKDGTEDAVPARNPGAGDTFTGVFKVTSTTPTGFYRKAILIEGKDGDYLLISPEDVGETLTITT